MPTQITMPQLGESVVDGTVGEWLKQVGDSIEEFEPIVRVSTDKVDTEIPAPSSGVLLEIYINEGDTVDAGVVLGVIGQADEQPPARPDTDAQPAPQPVAQSASSAHSANHSTSAHTGDYDGHVTPVVARMAREHDLDLSQITGTGRDGRIRKKDVLAYLETRNGTHQAKQDTPEEELAPWEVPGSGSLFKPSVNYEEDDTSEPAPAQSAPQPKAGSTSPPAKTAPTPQGVPGELVKLSAMRQSIAKHMVESKLHTAPHVTTVMEADLHRVSAHRATHKADFAQQGVKLTFTPYFVLAVARALQAVPLLNARWTEDGLFYPQAQHIGMAVALGEGLIVPVIKHAGDYNLIGLARQVNDLAERARQRQLKPDEVRDGTFTITNHGVSGSLVATPIINQPQSGILGVGMIEKRVKVIDDAIAIRPCAYLSLTFDHRVADGATADAFLMTIKQTLEDWS
ncbi:MAG: dihydrolipoamide acetyltransferase family protein [Anaerolineae bacterium]